MEEDEEEEEIEQQRELPIAHTEEDEEEKVALEESSRCAPQYTLESFNYESMVRASKVGWQDLDGGILTLVAEYLGAAAPVFMWASKRTFALYVGQALEQFDTHIVAFQNELQGLYKV